MILLPILTFGPMLAAMLIACIGRRTALLRDMLTALTGAAAFVLCLLLCYLGDISFALPGFCGLGLTLRADGFRSLYGCIAAFMWMMTGLFSPEYMSHGHHRTRYAFFTLLTLGATLGVFFSDDLFTTFIFFEVMSFTSYAWVAHEETPGALKAANTYLSVAIIGGLTTLMGLFLLYHQQGSLAFDALKSSNSFAGTIAAWLVVVGFAAKAGLYPLHIWLPQAHPVAPAPASALLSGILTKSGIFGLIVVCSRIMAGNAAFGNALMALACVTMVLGAVLALFSTDLKRTLACSSMSQIGFICTGLASMTLLGEHGSLAAYGTVMHMANHSLIKLTLFMAAGVIYMNTHALDLDDIRGFGRRKPLLHIAFLLGTLSIACIPPIGSGYASKSLLHEALLEVISHQEALGQPVLAYRAAEVLFLVSGGLTVAYMLKLYVCIFWEKHPTRQSEFDAQKSCMRPVTAIALLGSAALLPFLGALPQTLLSPLGARSAAFFGQHAVAEAIPYFSAANLQGAGISIAIGLGVYLFIVRPLLMSRQVIGGAREYINLWPDALDLENRLYRPMLLTVLPQVLTFVCRLLMELPEAIVMGLRRTVFRQHRTHRAVPVGNRFTYALGCMFNAAARLLNTTLLHRSPMRTDFEYLLAASWRELREGTRNFTVSISFGLLLLCVGLYLTCLYLLQ